LRDRLLLPEELRRRLLRGPQLFERLALVELAVLDDLSDLRDVADARERVGVEHHQVGQLAGLDRTKVRARALRRLKAT
jgi:hypothetical protein